MAKLELTRGDIITEGLSLAGRPDLVSSARLWLNLYLEEFYMTQDVEWLVKTLNDQALSSGMSMPTDYRAAKSAIITDSNGAQRPIEIINNASEYDERRMNAPAKGSPLFIYANHDLMQFYPVPAPTQGETLDLKYYYIPDIPDHSVAANDDEVPKWELPMHILVDFIKGMAHDYNDDQRHDSVMQRISERVMRAKMNNRDSRAGSTRMMMGKRFRNRFR